MKIAIIGRGNVGTHLAKAFANKGVTINLLPHSAPINNPDIDPDTDLILICVKDSFVTQCAAEAISRIKTPLPESTNTPIPIIAHTSGSTPLKSLEHAIKESIKEPSRDKTGQLPRLGVFYPLQSFSKDVEMDLSDTPFLIEASDEATFKELARAASLISDNVIATDSATRGQYHLASVFACNFSNLMMTLADEFLSAEGLDFSILLPLIRQTINKLSSASPTDAQTGPAIRGDEIILSRHKALLASDPEKSEIYTLLSNSIKNRRKK